MQGKTTKQVVINQYGQKPVIKQAQLPELKDGQILIKLEASTINPSDRLFIEGKYFQRELPAVCGLEGTGRVQDAKGQAVQKWKGKRICLTNQGTWSQYVIKKPEAIFQIDQEVSLECAASGIVNPLTVIGFYYTFKDNNLKGGIIHTAAASALGRMLNKLCISKNVPLLNIVRRKQQADLLKSEGAKHVVVTADKDWVDQVKALIKQHNFDCLFDAIGGGPISTQLVRSLPPTTKVHIYGALDGGPLEVSPTQLLSGQKIEGFLVFPWWMSTSQQNRDEITKDYSKYLKNELKTNTFKNLSFQNIEQALELSVSKATEGKILLKF